ncbi:MAG TPA: hypothetical protein VHQ65_02375 [Thermoanaerobaculia bacterium]|nr:hypothetical protein [Thermoanaerobaculia bacterium]
MKNERFPRLPRCLGLLPFALLLVVLPGCGGGEEEAAERLEDKSAIEVLEEAGEDEYTPPEDGELTEEQMEMYLAVQERAIDLRQAAAAKIADVEAKVDGSTTEAGKMFEAFRAVGQGVGVDLFTADVRAAQELGHNTAEYQWVQSKIFEAQAAQMMRGMAQGMREMQQQMGPQMIAMLEASKEAASTAEDKAEIQRQIDELEQAADQPAEEEELEPGVAHNIELYAKYQERIQELQQRNVQAMEGATEDEANP